MVPLELLRRYSFLADLSDDELAGIAMLAEEVRFSPGATILEEGRPATKLYLLVQGQVGLWYRDSAGRPEAVGKVTPGQVFGASALIPPYILTASVKANEPVRAIAIEAAGLRAMAAVDWRLGYTLMQHLAQAQQERLQYARIQLGSQAEPGPRPPARQQQTEKERVANLGWWIHLRWLVGASVFAVTGVASLLLGLRLATAALWAVGAAILIYNTLFYRAWKQLQQGALSARHASRLTHAQIAADWVAMTLLVYFSGGIESPLILYFPFHIVLAAINLTSRAAFGYAGLAGLVVCGMAALEYTGLLPHQTVGGLLPFLLYRRPLYVSGVLFFFTTAMFAMAYLAASTAGRLEQGKAEILTLGRQLEHAYQRLQALYRVAQTAGSAIELTQVLERLAQSTAQAMGVQGCSIRLLDETRTRLTLTASFGLGAVSPTWGSLAGDGASVGTLVASDATTGPRLEFPAETISGDIHSTLTVALVGQGGPLGLIRAYSTEPRHFTDDDVTFLTAIASQGSIAIENAIAHEKLSRLDQSKSRFVMTVTHELRSPVGVAQSLLRTLVSSFSSSMPEQQRDLVERAMRRIGFLQSLIDDLLDMAAGKSDLAAKEELVAISLAPAIERVVKRFEAVAAERHIKLEWHNELAAGADTSREAGPPAVRATNEGMDRILNNLVSNAVKYSQPGGCVTVALRRARPSCLAALEMPPTDGQARNGNRVCVEVCDTGIGIPEAALPHLFEEFYRAPNAKAIEKHGTGLGLVITKDLVTRYGGRITVQSKEGQGTTFHVVWPLLA